MMEDNKTCSEMETPTQKWIPVAERLPDDMEWVLCALGNGEVAILAYDFITDDWDVRGRPNYCYSKSSVTHWMPMPPKEGE